jgi:hypothetical protein
MIIDKDRVDRSLRKVRGLYRNHVEGELSPSDFVTQARSELHALYMQHTRALIGATASRFIEEIRSFQTQFGLELECELNLTHVARGYRGIRASIYIRNKVYTYYPGSAEIFIGPFDEWDKVAVHTREDLEADRRPSLYTKRRRNSWQGIQDFNFPDLLQRIKEETEKPKPDDDEEDIPF